VGAFAERMKFSSMLLFTALWLFAVYIPVCHLMPRAINCGFLRDK